MENKIKIGQSFEVVEWLETPTGLQHDKYIGKQGIKDDVTYGILTPHYSVGDLVSFGYTESQIKPIGKITITKLK